MCTLITARTPSEGMAISARARRRETMNARQRGCGQPDHARGHARADEREVQALTSEPRARRGSAAITCEAKILR
jgi:hypothetical protein